ncbi:hypothetical protein STCU_11205 [Strigomonas culicis]|uniref:Uncharacterized protein n=1 Tax=Strigomonas culicis TaxID=28005 RepID=S9V112_9TRYP|nr:hypothetical protein STCU_11205 [Strigomonas culicis]|eukprot:EPY16490.1 hypothetical protein STCU_11205 [Strigomonas culicis]
MQSEDAALPLHHRGHLEQQHHALEKQHAEDDRTMKTTVGSSRRYRTGFHARNSRFTVTTRDCSVDTRRREVWTRSPQRMGSAKVTKLP